MVRPKKFLGQHFLKDEQIAQKIVSSLELKEGMNDVVEIGPGTGVLTKYLMANKEIRLKAVELDRESVPYLKTTYPNLAKDIIEADVLKMDWDQLGKEQYAVIGNFPYNISSQIFFKVLEHRDKVEQVVCMLQKEVAERIASPKGNKVYGILSVLLQAYYEIELLFKVPPGVFFPPPKVMSAVIRLKRNKIEKLDCDEVLFKVLVKQGFQNRRKTLRNALKRLNLPASITSLPMLDKRAEQLSVGDFVSLTQQITQANG